MAILGKLQVTMMPNLELIDGQKKVSQEFRMRINYYALLFLFGTKKIKW
jgi:hypothetical protein